MKNLFLILGVIGLQLSCGGNPADPASAYQVSVWIKTVREGETTFASDTLAAPTFTLKADQWGSIQVGTEISPQKNAEGVETNDVDFLGIKAACRVTPNQKTAHVDVSVEVTESAFIDIPPKGSHSPENLSSANVYSQTFKKDLTAALGSTNTIYSTRYTLPAAGKKGFFASLPLIGRLFTSEDRKEEEKVSKEVFICVKACRAEETSLSVISLSTAEGIKSMDVKDAGERAGTNRVEILWALEKVPEAEALAMTFLVSGMPDKDLQTLSADYLLTNMALAAEARRTAPWRETLTDAIYLNDILPYSSIHEEADAWRPVFREWFWPLVKDCKTTTEAAEILNREIWKRLNVTYNPHREKADQSPFHSMRIQIASCSGLSILLVDACRAVGIPARFVGCNWKHKPGNHSWVEIWDRGEWFHLGAEDAPKVNQAWFNADVVHAVADDPKYAIYATSWRETGEWFYNAFGRKVPGVNVTAHYLALNGEKPIPRLSIDLRDVGGERIALPLLLVEAASGDVLAKGTSHDNRFDLNNHLNFSFPEGTEVRILTDDENRQELGHFIFGKTDTVLKVKHDSF